MYKIGDRVIYQGADKDAYKRVGTLKSIEEKDGKPQFTVEFDNGETFTAPVDDWSREFTNACKNGCTSTNSVVRNAMAARRVARNADVNKNFGFARILAYKDGGLGTRFVVSWDYDRLGVVYGGSWNDDGKKAVAETKANISKFEKLIADLKQAAAWLDQNGSKIEV